MDFTALGLLILRVCFGGAMVSHGLQKLLSFSNMMGSFPDPIGLGSTVSLSLTVFAEFLCAILVMAGLFTRFAAIPLVVAMAVAFFIIHGSDPFAKKEMAFLYMAAFSAILSAGPGKYSLDGLFRKVK